MNLGWYSMSLGGETLLCLSVVFLIIIKCEIGKFNFLKKITKIFTDVK